MVCMHSIKVESFEDICGNTHSSNYGGHCKKYCDDQENEFYWNEDVY